MTNSQIAEKFSEGRTEGKGSNVFIEGDIIYSYGYHFAIARRLTDNVALFTSRSYSNSTAKHKNHVWSALYNANYKIVEVEDPKKELSQKTLDELYDKAIDLSLKVHRARKSYTRTNYLEQLENVKNDYKFIQSLI